MNALPIIILAGIILLAFPLFPEMMLYGSVSSGRLCFSIRLFGIPLKKGYVTFGKNGMEIHTKRKIDQKSYGGKKKWRGMFKLLCYRQILFVGSGENLFPAMTLITLANCAFRSVYAVQKVKRPSLKLRQDTLLLTDRTELSLLLRMASYTNPIMIAWAFIRNLRR
ncbi:MAG: hypothetical protein ACI4U2_02470 [Christensenellaceae bacterium]